MLPLVNNYLLTGPESKKSIAYSLALGLADLLGKEVVFIDSGKPANLPSYDNLTVVNAKGLPPAIDSLRVMNQLVKHYSTDKITVLNAPYEFMQHLMEAVNRSLLTQYITNFLGLFSKRFKAKADFLSDEKRIYQQAVKVLTKFSVPDWLSDEQASALQDGWVRSGTPMQGLADELTINSLMIHVITADDFINSVKAAMYNEVLAYLTNCLPYNVYCDTSTHSLNKYLILPDNPLIERLVVDNFIGSEYELIKVEQPDDSLDSMINAGRQLVSNQLKPLKGVKSFMTRIKN